MVAIKKDANIYDEVTDEMNKLSDEYYNLKRMGGVVQKDLKKQMHEKVALTQFASTSNSPNNLFLVCIVQET